MDSPIKHVKDESFEKEVLQSKKPVLVDYWAPWCGPCKSLAPILEGIAPEYDRRITIAKMDVDENPKTAEKFGIRGIPAMMIFKDGEVVGTKVGLVSEDELKVFINTHIEHDDEDGKSDAIEHDDEDGKSDA